jgi:hypothetical protein
MKMFHNLAIYIYPNNHPLNLKRTNWDHLGPSLSIQPIRKILLKLRKEFLVIP